VGNALPVYRQEIVPRTAARVGLSCCAARTRLQSRSCKQVLGSSQCSACRRKTRASCWRGWTPRRGRSGRRAARSWQAWSKRSRRSANFRRDLLFNAQNLRWMYDRVMLCSATAWHRLPSLRMPVPLMPITRAGTRRSTRRGRGSAGRPAGAARRRGGCGTGCVRRANGGRADSADAAACQQQRRLQGAAQEVRNRYAAACSLAAECS